MTGNQKGCGICLVTAMNKIDCKLQCKSQCDENDKGGEENFASCQSSKRVKRQPTFIEVSYNNKL